MISPLRRRSRRSLAAVALLVPALVVPPLTAEPNIGTADCTLPPGFSYFIRPLNRVAARVAGGLPVTVVALGSSSTAGAGATGPAASYPSRLAVALADAFPQLPIKVLNRGVNGEEVPEMQSVRVVVQFLVDDHAEGGLQDLDGRRVVFEVIALTPT